MVFCHGVRTEYIGAYLRAPFDFFHVAFHGVRLRLTFLYLLFEEFGTEHFEAHFLILELRTLVLALHDDSRGVVRDSDRRGHFVDVLAARAARMVNVDADIVVLDFHFVVVLDLGHDLQRAKGRMAAFVRVERGNPNEAVDAHFRFEIPVGVFAFHAEVDALDSRFVARFPVQLEYLKAHLFTIAGIHSVQHGTPIARLRSARARVERQKRVMRIVRPFQNRADTHILDILIRRLQHAVEFGNQAFVARLLDEVDDLLRVFERGVAFGISADFIFDMRNLPADFRRFFQILPDFRLFLFLFELFEARALVVQIQRVSRFVQPFAHILYL